MPSVAGFLALVYLAVPPAGAAESAVSGPPVRLDSKPVDWVLMIASGQTCVRGLRSGAMTLDSVTIASPAKFGTAATQGYGFDYRAPTEFKGEDAFSVDMTGSYRGLRGGSTLPVQVIVR